MPREGKNLIRGIEAPGGGRFVVIIAPPGSTLDFNPPNAGGAIGAVVLMIDWLWSLVRSNCWRVAVERTRGQSWTETVHRERCVDQTSAEARADSIIDGLRRGEIAPWRARL